MNSRATQGQELDVSALEAALELRLWRQRNAAIEGVRYAMRLVGGQRQLVLHLLSPLLSKEVAVGFVVAWDSKQSGRLGKKCASLFLIISSFESSNLKPTGTCGSRSTGNCPNASRRSWIGPVTCMHQSRGACGDKSRPTEGKGQKLVITIITRVSAVRLFN